MMRSVAVVVALSLLASAAAAQTQAGPGAQTPTTAAATKKPASQNKAGAKPAGTVESGPCQIGVVSAIDDKFAVQKIGITVFGNELAEAPVEWGFDDIVVERVRAAAPAGTAVRRIAFPRDAFDRYYNPPETLFGSSRGDFVAIVQQITATPIASATS